VRITIAGQDGDDARAYNEDDVRGALAALAQEIARRAAQSGAQEDKGQR
jgi:hypothetical protein